jgi:hypothetical protein
VYKQEQEQEQQEQQQQDAENPFLDAPFSRIKKNAQLSTVSNCNLSMRRALRTFARWWPYLRRYKLVNAFLSRQ